MTTDKSLVVGDSCDLGAAIVERLLTRGDQIYGVSRRGLSGQQGDYTHVPFDFDSDRSVKDLFRDEFSRADFNHLIYVAGFYKLQPLSNFSDGQLDQHYSLNLKNMIDFSRFFISRQSSDTTRQRSITLISSIAHKLGEPGLVAYSSTKAAMVAAARSMALEFAHRNVRVNSVSPGWIEGRRAHEVRELVGATGLEKISRQYPLGFGSPDDVAYAVEFLTDSTRAKWITGSDLVVDGGRSCS